jgi:cysteinyl-tRNA synthetase
MTLRIYNTLKRQMEVFKPLQAGKVSMYVCGPTVYDWAHLGNARPVVIFDTLYRLLSLSYDVTYVRNITDIDDKIIQAAFSTGESIETLTAKTTALYFEDMDALGALRPTLSPRATDHVPQMIDLIQILIEKSFAYEAQGHVLFETPKDPTYGCLSGHPLEEMIAGARVEVAPYKKNPQDFILWKPSTPDIPGWESPWGFGRPGWHIECSAMIRAHLGVTFDIHGGGQDLIFPHHENEIAQSICALGEGTFARYWMHNGMLMVNGAKMSKSLGNFRTVHELRAQAEGETIRFALLSTHYRQPLDWQDVTLKQAKAALDSFYTALEGFEGKPGPVDPDVLSALEEDLNTPLAIARLHEMARQINKSSSKQALQASLKASGALLGILTKTHQEWFQGGSALPNDEIDTLIAARNKAREAKNFAESDRIRDLLKEKGILLEDSPHGTHWKRG